MDSLHDLLPLFLSEADAAIAMMGASLDVLRACPFDAAAAKRFVEGAHTIGGLAAVAGCPAIAEFAGLMEVALKRFDGLPREDGVEIGELLDSSLRALRRLVALAALGRDDVPSDLPELTERLGCVCAARRESARTILIVDDSRTVLRFAARALSQAGFRVETATTEGEAAALLSRERPAMILVDLSLAPGHEGALLAHLGGGPGAEIPIVLFSNRPAEELEQLRRGAGAAGVIPKTGDAAAFVEAVNDLLDRRANAPEAR